MSDKVSPYEFDTTMAYFSSDGLCPAQKCVVSRVGLDGRKFYPCVCDIRGELDSSVVVPKKDLTTEELVDKLIEKGYTVTLRRP